MTADLPPYRPLAGVRVLDLSRVLAGPYCTMLLGDLGAEVIKVERPGAGDITRAWGPPFAGGESAYYLCCNRNKRSIAIDFQQPAGVDLIHRFAAQSDVVIENFRHGALAKLGFGWEALQRTRPDLIGCSISGYGRSGPDRELAGYDVVLQAASGFMSITGEPAGAPMKVGVAVVDLLTALFAAQGILAALYAKLAAQQAGLPPPRGPIIDLALMDCALAGLANVAQSALVTGQPPVRHGNAHPNIVPYQLFLGGDGEYFILALGSDGQWPALCALLNAPDLAADARFATNPLRVQNRAELISRLDAIFRRQPAAYWLAQLTAASIPCGPVNRLDQVLTDPQIQHRGMLQPATHPALPDLRLIANPLHWLWPAAGAASTPKVFRHPPRLGEHTAEILTELGLTAAEQAALFARGTVSAGPEKTP